MSFIRRTQLALRDLKTGEGDLEGAYYFLMRIKGRCRKRHEGLRCTLHAGHVEDLGDFHVAAWDPNRARLFGSPGKARILWCSSNTSIKKNEREIVLERTLLGPRVVE